MAKNTYRQKIYGNPNWVTGRINRSEYFVRVVLNWLTFAIMVTIATMGYAGVVIGGGSLVSYAMLIGCGALAAWAYWRVIMAYVKRLHDLGWSGWLSLLMVFSNAPELLHNETLTLVGLIFLLIFSLILLFKRGTKGPNAYGQDPLTKYTENE